MIRSGEGFNKVVCQVSLNLQFADLSGEELKCEKDRFFAFLKLSGKQECNKKARGRPSMSE
jgi:hypothetical protein